MPRPLGLGRSHWHARAEYYTGRQENDQANQAYLKAVEVAAKEPGDNENDRRDAAFSYAFFLERNGGRERAVSWLETELRKSPLTGAYAKNLVDLMISLAGYSGLTFGSEDETLWGYLAAQPVWGTQAHGLLAGPIAQTTGAAQEAVWQRLEKLATHADPSRAQILALLLLAANQNERAMFWFQDALRRLPDGPLRHETESDLYTLYLKLNDWRKAEALLPEAMYRYQLDNRDLLCKIDGDLALAAARAGDSDDAMRFYRKVVN